MENNRTSFRTFALSVVYGFGAIGGVVYPLVTGYWYIALGVAAVAAMAFPFIKSKWQ